MLISANSLWFVDMTQRPIIGFFCQCIDRQTFNSAHDSTLGSIINRKISTGSMQMSHNDNRFSVSNILGFVQNFFIESCDAFEVIIPAFVTFRIIAQSQKRNCYTTGYGFIILLNRINEFFVINLVVIGFFYLSDKMNIC